MNANWIVALACGAALALGACSGSNPAPATGTDGGGAGNGNGDGGTDPAPTDKTPEEMAFDTELKTAREALADAQRLVSEAVAQSAAAETDAQRAAAMAAILAATKALADAKMAAEALDPPEGDLTRLGQRANLIDDVTEAQTDADMRIPMARASVAWYGTPLSRGAPRAAVFPIPEVTNVVFTRRAKFDDDGVPDGDAEGLLKPADLPPVMHADGKVLISGTAASSGDMLRLRGYEATIHRGAQDNRFQTGNWRPIAAPTADRPTGGSQLLVGFQITSDGLAVRMGGKGAEGMEFRTGLYHDMPYNLNPDRLGRDVAMTFGAPQLAADGNGDFQWTANLMPDDFLKNGKGGSRTPPGATEAHSVENAGADSKAAYVVGGRILPVTIYSIWLSNHVGVDTNLEDPNDPVASAEDDVQEYLSSAAYGLMTARSPGTVPVKGPDSWDLRQRVHGFHLGYDAFADEDDMKTTDIGKDDAIIRGKFVGETMAMAVGSADDGTTTTVADADATLDIANAERLRGDVSLTATISGTQANNLIEGTMSNFEVFDPNGAFWKAYARLPGSVALVSNSIGADGSFNGVVTAPTGFEDGQYSGSFYGPKSGLEVGGAWFLHPDNTVKTNANKGIVGSFGAKMQ